MRCFVFLIATAVLTEGAAAARQSPAAQAQPQSSAARKFSAEAGILFTIVRPEKAEQFEYFLAKVHQSLQDSTDPVRKKQAAGWRVYKMSEPDAKGNLMYVYFVEPAVAGADYTDTLIVREGVPAETAEIYQMLNGAFVAQSIANLTLVRDFSRPLTGSIAKPSSGSAGPPASAAAGAGPSAQVTTAWGGASVETRVTESTEASGRYAWRLSVKNESQTRRRFDAVIEFQDLDGVVVDTARQQGLVIEPGQQHTFTGDHVIQAKGARKVAKVSLKLEEQ